MLICLCIEIILKVQVASVGEALRKRDSVAWMLGPLCHHLLCDFSMPVTSLVQECSHMPSLCICISPAASEAWLWVFFRVPCFVVSGIQGFLGPKESTLPSLLSTRTLKCLGKAQCPEVLVRMHVCAHQWTNLPLVNCSLNSDQLTTDNRGRTPDRKGFIFFFCKISLGVVFQPLSRVCDPMDRSTPDFPILHYFWSLLKLMSIELVMPSHPLSPASPPALNLSQHWGLFQRVAFCIRWSKYWSFSMSPSNEYSGLISFRDWLVWSPWGPRDFQVFSNITVQSISSLVLSLLYGPTLTTVRDYWKNYSFEYMYFCWQSDVSAF